MATSVERTSSDSGHGGEGMVQRVALPLHVQMLQKALTMDHFIKQFDQLFCEYLDPKNTLTTGTQPMNTVPARDHQFNFDNITDERKWVKDLLCSKSDCSGSELSESEQLQIMLELQAKRRKIRRKRLKKDPKLLRYKYFSSGILTENDLYPEHLKTVEKSTTFRKPRKPRKVKGSNEATELKRQELWAHIVKKDIPRMAKQFSLARHTTVNNNKKIAQLCVREVKKLATKSQRASKEVSGVQPRAKRLMREALIYWRKYEKVEREQRKKAEKEATEQNKLNQEMMEAKRQQRKLNFLITQTELYAHFMAKKLTGEEDNSAGILKQLDDAPVTREVRPGVVIHLEQPGEYDCESIKAQVMANVQSAMQKQQTLRQGYSDLVAPQDGESMQESFDKQFSLATPMLVSDREMPQPTMFNGKLKSYQLKGMNWLANLYDQGINGILADEMGLGKTVQSIAFLSHLAENQNNWGPFLIVSPASTLHNWQQEASRFVPKLKALPYWGSPPERKVIRKYWNPKLLCKENAPFHILITSYQLVVQDMKYFQRVKWQYMILDEAQAIKSSTSVRWKVLLSFNCRNRLLLTGTPIQNTMQELWALLHFIMPTMFDSHEEFNEWFSKDIESHAEKKSVLDEHQLSRLHLILKPFMLRRIKKDVEHEMAEKIEIHLSCELSTRQKLLYHGLRERISIEQLLQSANTSSSKDSASSHLLNLVMQFRKVCNHPDLFERRNVEIPVGITISPYTVPRLIYHSTLEQQANTQQLLTVTLGLHTAHSIHCSSLSDGLWSFLRLVDLSPSQGSTAMLGSLPQRLSLLLYLIKRVHLLYQQRLWHSQRSQLRSVSNQLLLWPSFSCSHQSLLHSPTLSALVFTSPTSLAYSHCTHNIRPINHGQQVFADLTEISSTVTNQDEKKSLTEPAEMPQESSQTDTGSPHNESSTVRHCVLTTMPRFLISCIPKALVPIPHLYCSDRAAEHARQEWLSGGPHHIKQLFLNGLEHQYQASHLDLLDNRLATGLIDLYQPHGWSHIHIPNKETMIYDSGKMVVLDKLLTKLKHEGHRVLIYSQMTRVIDLLEEFMAYRRHKFIRLDGSSRISDRRDMVADFQTNSEIFAFLLSTRAGGLGINLTAADTVIFYDSDWNPTVDQQAMDRAHRLGQTKQVTVYRLIVRGSIEERILQRAKEKSEIQKMVISGGDFKPDTLKAKDMVSLLLHDDEMETRFLAKQAEKKATMDQLQQAKKNKNKRKNAPNGTEIEPATKRSLPVSATPSPLLSSNRPESVMSHNSAVTNGDDIDTEDHEISKPGGTPVREIKKRTTARRANKNSSAPLGGRGRMQRSGKKPNSGSAAASAGAIAGALAANNAAFATYGGLGYIVSPHSAGSPGSALASTHGSSTQSSPRTSPQPFVATSLNLTTPPHKNSKLTT